MFGRKPFFTDQAERVSLKFKDVLSMAKLLESIVLQNSNKFSVHVAIDHKTCVRPVKEVRQNENSGYYKYSVGIFISLMLSLLEYLEFYKNTHFLKYYSSYFK